MTARAAILFSVLAATPALAHIPSYHEIRGTILSNTIAQGPFVTALPGESAFMYFELIHPGLWIVPQQLEQYTIITSGFVMEAGEASITIPGDALQYAYIENNFTNGDAFVLPSRPATYPFYTLEFVCRDTTGAVFRNSDTWTNFAYYPASRFDQGSWTVTDSRGGQMSVRLDSFMMMPGPGSLALLGAAWPLVRRRR